MGTRSLTYVVDEHNQVLCAMYRQFDGYPDEHGMGGDLYRLLKGRKLCNGFGLDTSYMDTSNGLEDLAALLVWYFKDDSRIGNIYLCPPPSLPTHEDGRILDDDDFHTLNDHCRERWGEYTYIITVTADYALRIVIFDSVSKLYDGSPDGMAGRFQYKNKSATPDQPPLDENGKPASKVA